MQASEASRSPTTGTTSEEANCIPLPRFAKEPRKLHIRWLLLPFPKRRSHGGPPFWYNGGSILVQVRRTRTEGSILLYQIEPALPGFDLDSSDAPERGCIKTGYANIFSSKMLELPSGPTPSLWPDTCGRNEILEQIWANTHFSGAHSPIIITNTSMLLPGCRGRQPLRSYWAWCLLFQLPSILRQRLSGAEGRLYCFFCVYISRYISKPK